MFKAAFLNAGLIAELSCLCDLPQLASQEHRAHAAHVYVFGDFSMFVYELVCFLYICVSALLWLLLCVLM